MIMKRLLKMLLVVLPLLALTVACESRIDGEQVVGRWELVSLDSEINDVESTEEFFQFDGDIYCVFNPDSTYLINDVGWQEEGHWTLRADSMLSLLPQGCADSTQYYTMYKIVTLDDSFMVAYQIKETDYGKVTETSKFKRCK